MFRTAKYGLCSDERRSKMSVRLVLFGLAVVFSFAGSSMAQEPVMNPGNGVNLEDFAVLAYYWMATDCASRSDCGGADFEPDGDVDIDDLEALLWDGVQGNWLNGSDLLECQAVFYSIGAEDGRVWDTNDGIGVGFKAVDTLAVDYPISLRLGDSVQTSEWHLTYRTILSFDTSLALPEVCNITAATLELTRGSEDYCVSNPFDGWGGTCKIDLDSQFGGSTALAAMDWQAAADAEYIAEFPAESYPDADDLPMESTPFSGSSLGLINTNGKTQFRVYFENSTNGDENTDYLGFWSGDSYAPEQYRPKLKITYLTTRTTTVTFTSIGAEDGRVWDIDNGGTGVGYLATGAGDGFKTFRVGDTYDVHNYGYRNVLSFDTSSLPDGYEVTAAWLELTDYGYNQGDSPFGDPDTWGSCVVDVKSGFFGTVAGLENVDFESGEDYVAATFDTAPAGEGTKIVSSDFDAGSLAYINKTGKTQLKVYFNKVSSNMDGNADYVSFYSGDFPGSKEPKLVVQYYIND